MNYNDLAWSVSTRKTPGYVVAESGDDASYNCTGLPAFHKENRHGKQILFATLGWDEDLATNACRTREGVDEYSSTHPLPRRTSASYIQRCEA